jgi:hypothetical protein
MIYFIGLMINCTWHITNRFGSKEILPSACIFQADTAQKTRRPMVPITTIIIPPCSLLLERMRSDFLISPDTWQSLYNHLRKSKSQRNPSQASGGVMENWINWNEFNNERQHLFEDI